MARIIAIALSKGGVGKTTTAVNLAAGLAKAGRRVLLVDTDTQNQAARALGVKSDVGLFEYVNASADAGTALVQARDELYVLAGGEAIGRLKRQFAQAEYEVEKQLANALSPLLPYFEYVIIDNSPGWDTLAVNVLFFAQEVLCPVTLETLAVQGLIDYVGRVERIGRSSGVKLAYVLPTMLDRRLAQTPEIHNQLKQRFGRILCDPIRANVRLSEAPAFGETIFEYSAESRGAQDYAKLVQRVIADEQTEEPPPD